MSSPAGDMGAPSEDWLKADLLEFALSVGLDVSASMTKAEILAAIRAAE